MDLRREVKLACRKFTFWFEPFQSRDRALRSSGECLSDFLTGATMKMMVHAEG